MDPNQILTYLFTLAIFLVSLSVHEYAHGWVAYKYGDDTAARMGRLTLNPIAHISLVGTIILPLLVHFGWAKPVPVNFSILSKRQIFMVAAAGPCANILLALVLAGAFHLLRLHTMPLLGDFVLLAILFNIILAVFNLIPIPPLDGSRMVYAKLESPDAIRAYGRFARFGILILIGFLWLGGFQRIILPIVGLLYTLLRLPLPALTIQDSGQVAGKLREGGIMASSGKSRSKQFYLGHSVPVRRRNEHGGTIINILTALIFFGLLGFGIMWVMKSFGEAGQQYGQAMVGAREDAISVKCQMNMRAIGQNIQMYTISNEGFPESQEDLVQFGGNSRLFKCPDPNGVEYVYIPGQRPGMPPENVLVYEPEPMHDGRCSVLLLGGQFGFVTPEELEQAIARTMATIR